MFAAIGCVVIGGTLVIGGPEEVLMRSQDRLEFFNIDPDPTVRHTLWTQMIGGTFIFCSIYAVNQAQVQRLLSTKSLASAQRALWIQWPILALLSLTTSYAGLVIHAFYKDCDPIQLGRDAVPVLEQGQGRKSIVAKLDTMRACIHEAYDGFSTEEKKGAASAAGTAAGLARRKAGERAAGTTCARGRLITMRVV